MSWLPDVATVQSATFKVLDGAGAGKPPFTVQFNPASLDYAISNEFDDRNGNNGARQFVKKSSAKLTMTLVFDTTETGASVRDVTANITALLEPAKDGTKKFAPKVEFGWGSYSFKGVIEQFKETIDFFSASGVPLRSSINLTLASQNVEFQSNKSPAPAVDRTAPPDPVKAAPGAGASDVANALGDPRAARAIASLNGSGSLRFGGGASLDVGGSISLAAAADFSVGGGAGFSAGGGAGISIGAGLSGGVGGGFGVSGGVGIGIGGGGGGGITGGGGVGITGGVGIDVSGVIGGGFSAAIAATSGAAFVGLRASPPTATVSVFDARAALLPAPGVVGSASFNAGGRAVAPSGGSLSADVGLGADGRFDAHVSFGD